MKNAIAFLFGIAALSVAGCTPPGVAGDGIPAKVPPVEDQIKKIQDDPKLSEAQKQEIIGKIQQFSAAGQSSQQAGNVNPVDKGKGR